MPFPLSIAAALGTVFIGHRGGQVRAGPKGGFEFDRNRARLVDIDDLDRYGGAAFEKSVGGDDVELVLFSGFVVEWTLQAEEAGLGVDGERLPSIELV